MSFNVRGSFRDLGRPEAWPNRAAANVAAIARHTPGLIGLQECQRGNLAAYRRGLSRYDIVKGPAYGNTPPHDFNAIIYDPERLDLVDSGGFWLSETPWRRSRSWGARVARSANWALFETEFGPLLHLNTHLDHKSPPARRNGSALIVRIIDELLRHRGSDVPTIVTGDLNCRPGTPTYRAFTDAGFADTFLATGNADTRASNTFHAFKGVAYKDPHPARGPRRLDYIFLKDPTRRLRVLSHGILRDHDERSGQYPSDHYPILATLAWSTPENRTRA